MRVHKEDKRKARRHKRRLARKVRYIKLDEGHLMYPKASEELKVFFRRIHLLSNQHLLNDKNELEHSAIVTQRLM